MYRQHAKKCARLITLTYPLELSLVVSANDIYANLPVWPHPQPLGRTRPVSCHVLFLPMTSIQMLPERLQTRSSSCGHRCQCLSSQPHVWRRQGDGKKRIGASLGRLASQAGIWISCSFLWTDSVPAGLCSCWSAPPVWPSPAQWPSMFLLEYLSEGR